MSVDVLRVALGAAMLALALWFYPHCARPCLAMAGGRPAAFGLALTGTLLASLGGAAVAVDGLINVPRLAFDLGRVAGIAFAVPAVGFLRPGWLVRLTGGPDPSVPVRFVATWYRGHWRTVEPDAATARRFAQGMARALRELDPPADPALVDRWLLELDALTRAADTGHHTTLARQRERLTAELGGVLPVDPAGRWLPG